MKFAVIDFETTGSKPDDDIIQIGLVIINEQLEIEQSYSSFVKPNKNVPPFITQLTGITQDLVEGAPSFDDIAVDILPLLTDTVLVGHHVEFDFNFLQKALTNSGYTPFSGRVLDTIDALRIFFPSMTSLQLSMVSQTLGVPHDNPHRADSDAEATANIWLKILEKADNLPLITIQRLTTLFENESTDFSWFLQELRNNRELKISEDIDVPRYFRQFAMNVKDWGEENPIADRSDFSDGSNASFEVFFEELKQKLQQKFIQYEDREAQQQMIEEVMDAFSDQRHLMIEAGTGTGKSLGYLIPALYYGIQNDTKVTISTHTINLQEQLRQRDIPLLQEIFPIPFQAAVLKGRNHYLCLRKFENKVNSREVQIYHDDRMVAAQMVVWLSETKHGDDEELHFGQQDQDFWRDVASDADSCLNRACPWFKKCFYHRAKYDANQADVVITNHSLLFTDVKADNRIIPSYQHLVIDEAHHFAEVAGKHLGMEVQYFSFVNALSKLYKDQRNGQLSLFHFRLQNAEFEQSEEYAMEIENLYPKIVEMKEQWDELANGLYQLLEENNHDTKMESGQYVLRMKDENNYETWEALKVMEENIGVQFQEIRKPLEKLLNQIKEKQDELAINSSITDVSGSLKDLTRTYEAIHFFMLRKDANYVYWMEASQQFKSKSLQLFSVPIDVSDMMQQFFFEQKDSIIMTSATLAVEKSFQYTCDQLGLNTGEDNRLKMVKLPSPFNYRKQALVCIPRDFPSIRGRSGETEFISELIASLQEIAITTQGRMLVLFTSYRMMKQTYGELKEKLTSYGIQLLAQGVDSSNRSKLTKLFTESRSAVLLGTSSFWEGVDIPGDALTCLAIVRLPFQPPTHPLVEAKIEQMKKNNLNPFMKLSVPQAVIRFKQGFGRLVRTENDRGIVIVYDTRVINTTYGKHFLYSLPGPKIEHMPNQQLVSRVREWMEGEDL